MLKFTKTVIRGAKAPECSLIPDIQGEKNLPFFNLDETVKDTSGLHIGEGMVSSELPHKIQNLYDRELSDREYTAAVLENEHLHATFLPELGGRLWSLYDKKLGRELLYKNDAVIYAQLALRNAWFAGGVEFNIGIKGHGSYTCSPLFCAKEKNSLGEDVLKMWEYEPVRGLAYVIRATLKDDELKLEISAENTRSTDTYMYWWSNIAAPQNEGTRVIAPANEAYVTSYRNGGYVISKLEVPYCYGSDVSYPAKCEFCKDFFFDVKDGEKKWIASIESDGIGLLHTADEILIGNKVFVWGNFPGGDHWNKWLTGTHGKDYYEIQAGLAKTQFEHFPIKPYEKLVWHETYRSATVLDAKAEFSVLKDEIGRSVKPNDDSVYFKIVSEESPILFGSGHGALAALAREDFKATVCDFPSESLGDEEKYFVDILNGKSGSGYTVSYCIEPSVYEKLGSKGDLNDYDKYQLGVMAYSRGDFELSGKYLEAVGGEYEWLAKAAHAMLLSNVKGDLDGAFGKVSRAAELNGDYLPLLHLYGKIAINAERYGEYATLYEASAIRSGRMQMYYAKALAEIGRLDEARAVLTKELIVPDIKEGEYAISKVWSCIYAKVIAKNEGRNLEDISENEVFVKYPLPYELDFRQS